MQVSFLELIAGTLEDFTLIVLVISGVASIVLEQLFGAGDSGWVEGAAILAAVAVVALVTAVNDYEKEQQFRELSALSSETEVLRRRAPSTRCCVGPAAPALHHGGQFVCHAGATQLHTRACLVQPSL